MRQLQQQMMLFLLLLWLTLAGVHSQEVDSAVCVETFGGETLPAMPASFHVTMATAVTPGNGVGHVTIMVDANISRSAVVSEWASAGVEFKAIFDSVTNQISVINHRADAFDIENCQVLNVSAASYSVMTSINFQGSDRVIPTGKFFSGTNLKIVKSSDTTINGVSTTPYRTCYYDSHLQGTLEVTWWYPADSVSPMQVKTAFRKAGDTASPQEVIYTVSPLRPMSGMYDATRHPFAAPRSVYCKGLVSTKKAPTTYDRFSLGAERYIFNLPEIDDRFDRIRESYDQRTNLTMLEAAFGLSLDQRKYGSGVLARINDFTRGISYVKNLRYENCTYEKIPEGDWDSDPSPNGAKIKTPDEFFFPSLNELQYKGSGVYRLKNVDIYIGYQKDYLDTGDGRKHPMTMEYYLEIKVSYDGIGNPTYMNVPITAIATSPSKFTSRVDIFDFFTGVPRAFDHDISDCFGTSQKQHFELILSTTELDEGAVKYLNEYRNELLYSVATSLAKALNISPLRIIQPEVSLFAPPLVLVEVTISDRANVPNYTPKIPEIPLSQVSGAMSERVGKADLFVDVMEGDLVFQLPIKDYVIMDARGGDPVSPGLSAGAAAGLSIGMILLGIIIGIGIIVAVNYCRKDSPFGFKPFGGQQEAST